MKISKLLFLPQIALFRWRILRGVQWCYFDLSVWHIFVKKTNLKIFIWTFWKLLDDMKAIFKPTDLKIGIYIVNIYMTQILHFFLKILIYKKFIEYFSLKLTFLKFSRSKIQNFEIWDNHFVHLIILRLLMFYNLKLHLSCRRSGRFNIVLVLLENRV